MSAPDDAKGVESSVLFENGMRPSSNTTWRSKPLNSHDVKSEKEHGLSKGPIRMKSPTSELWLCKKLLLVCHNIYLQSPETHQSWWFKNFWQCRRCTISYSKQTLCSVGKTLFSIDIPIAKSPGPLALQLKRVARIIFLSRIRDIATLKGSNILFVPHMSGNLSSVLDVWPNNVLALPLSLNRAGARFQSFSTNIARFSNWYAWSSWVINVTSTFKHGATVPDRN